MSDVTADSPVTAAVPAWRRRLSPAGATPTGLTIDTWPRFVVAIALAALIPVALGGIGVLTDFRALVLGSAAAFAVAGLSLNVLMGYAGQISLGHFALVGLGAFMSAKLTDPLGPRLPFTVGLLVAAAVCGVAALIVGLPSLRLRGLHLAVVTIGFAYAMEKSILPSKLLSKGSGGVELPRPWVGSYEFRSNAHYLALLCVIVVIVWLIDTNVTSSKIGRAFRAVREDEQVAASFGVDVARYKLAAFTLSGVFAGVAGAMYGHLFGFVNSESFRFDRSLLLVIIVVVGGLGSRVGVLAAAAFYGVFPLLLNEIWGNSAVGIDLIVGALLLIFTVARNPGGLAAGVRHAREDKERRQMTLTTGAAADTDDAPTLPHLPRPEGLPTRSTAGGDTVLDVRGVTVDFGGLRAVDDASISVPRNKIVGLIGPNGAGKTTLFNAISGALTPQAGTTRLLGDDVSSLPAHARAAKGIGRTFQSIGLAKDLTVHENLLLAQHQVATYDPVSALSGLGSAPAGERDLRQRATQAIAALGFERYTDTPVGNLSGGQQRIVELACALITAPELVMLDEPSAGMAPGAVENLAVRLRDLRDELGRTVLLIEHNIPLVLDVCDELYVMAGGQVIAHGAPDDVVADPAVITAYLGEPAP